MKTDAIFDIASRHAQWTSVRQSVVSTNLANQSVNNFEARTMAPFQAVVEQKAGQLAATSAGHFGINASTGEAKPEVTTTGGAVNLEEQLAAATDVRNQMQLNISVTASFHRMILTTLGG